MTCFNQIFFDPPRRDVAIAWAMTGLTPWYLETKLIAGTILWRMGSSSSPWEMNAASPWWISQGTFDHIVTSAETVAGNQHRLDRTYRRLARMKLAVLPTFGRHDMVIRLVLRQRTRVLQGRGRFVQDDKDNAHYRAIGAFEIEQVFLPGLSFPDTSNPGDVLNVSRRVTPGWQDHVEVQQFKATAFFAM